MPSSALPSNAVFAISVSSLAAYSLSITIPDPTKRGYFLPSHTPSPPLQAIAVWCSVPLLGALRL